MGKVLLVVDDSRTIRTAVELIFEGTEYRVIAKETGESGLAWMRTHTPDLILIDERMPDMDGYDFGSKIKADSKNEDVPILLLACQDGPDESKADNADLDGYVNKPFGSQELVTLVEMLTGSSQISQMPLSFKEQLSQRQREKQARVARGESADLPRSPTDDLLSLEAALADTAVDEKKPKKEEPRKDEPVVEIPIVENQVQVAPVRLESKSVTATIDLSKPKPELKPEPRVESKPAPKPEPKPEPKTEPKPFLRQELETEDTPHDDDFTPEPVIPSPIPHADLVEAPPPPPRFPPPPPPAELVMPSFSKREVSPSRRPKPDPIFLRESVPPPPRPPPPPMEMSLRVPDMMVKIETPIEAPDVIDSEDQYVDITPEPSSEEPTPVPTPNPKPVSKPVSKPVEPAIPIEAPAIAESWSAEASNSSEQSIPVAPVQPPPSSSRGILFALLAMAVILGLVAFYFVSQ